MDERARLLARQGQAYISSDLVHVVDEEMNDIPRDGQTIIDGNPLEDIRVLTTPDQTLLLIMKEGQIYKNQL